MEFTARDFVSRSDRNGYFSIPGETDGSAEFWVEAENFAPKSLGTVEFREAGTDLGTTALEPGGRMVISAVVPPAFPADDYLIALRRVSEEETDRVAEAAAYPASMRPLEGTGEIVYRSLTPGDYEVWLKPRIRSGWTEPPTVLTTARVRPGEATVVEVPLPSGRDRAVHESGGEIAFFLPGVVPTQVGPLEARLWGQEGEEQMAVSIEEVSGGSRVRVPVDCTLLTRVQLYTEGRVSEAVDVSRDECASLAAREIELVPRARLRGTVQVPVGYEKPRRANFDVRECQSKEATRPLGRFPFAVGREGRFSADVPAGCVDLSLVAPGFAPVAVTDLTLVPRGEREIGAQRLMPGATLLLRCVSRADGRPAPGVRVDIVPEEEFEAAIAAIFRRGELVFAAGGVTGLEGWARFDGLSAGTYRIRAIGESGLATFSPPVALEPAVEAIVDLELPMPASVEVTVSEGRLSLADEDRLTVIGTGAATCDWLADVVVERAVDAAGTALFTSLHPGTWLFSLYLHGAGGGFQLAEESIELLPGTFSSLTLPLDGHVFTGEVTWLGGPVEAHIRLRSREEDTRGTTVATAQSRKDGGFRLILKEPGIHDVEVWIRDEGRSVVPEIAFEDPDEWVEVKLGAGAIEGVVVDPDGRPVAGARLHARRVAGLEESALESAARAETDGSFRLERLSSGRWQLRASAEKGKSEVEEVRLEDQEVRSGVVLTIHEGATLRGRLESGGMPVAGATGWVTCLWTGAQELCGGVFRTEPTGEFSFDLGRVPEGARVNVLIAGEGIPLDAFIEEVGRELVTLAVARVGGRVTLSDPVQPLTQGRATRMLLVNARGGIVPAARGAVVRDGTQSEPESLVFPNLAPGVWRLFEFGDASELELAVPTGGTGLPANAVFEVAPGADLGVSLGGP